MLLGMGIVHHVNFLEIVRHPWFMSSVLAAVSAHLLKLLLKRVTNGVWDWRELKSSGGMPSVHASLVSALAFAVGLTGKGLSSRAVDPDQTGQIPEHLLPLPFNIGIDLLFPHSVLLPPRIRGFLINSSSPII